MTRESKIKYIKSFGYGALEKAALAVMRKQGVEDFLTDEQLEEVYQHQVSKERITEQIKSENRRNMRIAS